MANQAAIVIIGELWGLFILIVSTLIMHLQKRNEAKDRNVYRLLVVCIVLLVNDCIAWGLDGHPGQMNRLLLQVSNFFVYTCNYTIIGLFIVYQWQMAKRAGEKPPLVFILFWVLICVSLAANTVGSFFGLYYTFDETNTYHRTDYFLLSQIASFVGLFTLAWGTFHFRDRLTRYERIASFSYFVLPAAATVVQLTAYGYAMQVLSLVAASLITFIVREQDIRVQLVHYSNALEREMDLAAALSEMYFSSYVVDLETCRFTEIKSPEDVHLAVSEAGGTDAPIEWFVNNRVMPEQAAEMRLFLDPTTVDSRMKELPGISKDYLSAERGWCRASWVPVERDTEGHTVRALFVVSGVDDIVKAENEYKLQLQEMNSQLEKRMAIISSVIKTYYAAYYIDLDANVYTELSTNSSGRSRYAQVGEPQAALYDMCQYLILPEFTEQMREFVDLSTLSERMAQKNYIVLPFIGITAGWSNACFIAGDRHEDGTLKSAIWASRTIHEEKKLEEENNRRLVEAMEKAEASNNAKTMFLNNMSHDLRTPMNAILGFTRLMEKQLDQPEVIQNYLGKIQLSGEYLLSIINNVLDMARIESGQVQLDENEFDILSERESIESLFGAELLRKNISVSVDTDVKHRYIIADKARMNQVLVNIISNSVKYTPEGGRLTVSVREEDCGTEGCSTYITTISDTGIGMSPEFLEHIFDSFSREHTTTESKVIGSGLGMSIVKKLVDLMGGTIEVESEAGKGSTFRITLQHRHAAAPKPPELTEAISEEADLEGCRILLAEDNDLNAEIAMAILEDLGLQAERAEDGVQCVSMLNTAPAGYYDLVLMDIQMPNLNGYDAARRIRALEDAQKAAIPIVAMTANAFEEDRQLAFAAGMNAHLAKPIDVPGLMETLSRLLRKG